MAQQGTLPAEDGARRPAQWGGEDAARMRQSLDARIATLYQGRMSWWRHWQELAEWILPRRYKWLISPNQMNKGSPINQRIINSKGTMAARNCAAGIMSGTTSPSRPWFRMTVPDPDVMADLDVQVWCEEVTKRMMRVMATSNYYAAKATQYLDLVIFGTAPLIIYEDREEGIRCFNPCAGEYFCATGPNFDVDTLFREFTMTASQVVREFGIENVSDTVRNLYMNTGSGQDQEVVIGHGIEPNPDFSDMPRTPGAMRLPRHFRYREFYWERATANGHLLRVSGFIDRPFSCPRWDVLGNDAYGRSPAMDALGDIKQLQLEERRKAQAIDKMVNPPMVGDISMKNEPASLLPGHVTYVAGGVGGVGFKPAYMVNPNLAELNADIKDVETRIEDAFFNDLFLMISQLDTVRTATEIDARREEKLVMLGPAMDRLQREGLSADINRVFQIMARSGLLPAPPSAMNGYPVKIEYISLLADLQKATALTSIERVWQFAGGIAGAVPGVLDNLNADTTMEAYADLLRVPPKILTTRQQRQALRQARDAATQQQTQLQLGAAAVGGAKTLSETDVGGGQNALSLMLNGGTQ